jgi:hypothetical protein
LLPKGAKTIMTTRTAIFLTPLLCLAVAAANAATYSGGTGTEATPYLISTVQDLLDLSDPANAADWDKHFRMTQDIDMSGVTGFTPIGSSTTKFTGVFDGGGFAIQNLSIDLPSQEYVGLFGYLDGSTGGEAEIRNLGLEKVSIAGKNYTGGLVGSMQIGTIVSCHVTGTINGAAFTGGLAGSSDASVINQSYAEGKIYGDTNTGGLCGYCTSTTASIDRCFFSGLVSSSFQNSGGLVGYA